MSTAFEEMMHILAGTALFLFSVTILLWGVGRYQEANNSFMGQAQGKNNVCQMSEYPEIRNVGVNVTKAQAMADILEMPDDTFSIEAPFLIHILNGEEEWRVNKYREKGECFLNGNVAEDMLIQIGRKLQQAEYVKFYQTNGKGEVIGFFLKEK